MASLRGPRCESAGSVPAKRRDPPHAAESRGRSGHQFQGDDEKGSRRLGGGVTVGILVALSGFDRVCDISARCVCSWNSQVCPSCHFSEQRGAVLLSLQRPREYFSAPGRGAVQFITAFLQQLAPSGRFWIHPQCANIKRLTLKHSAGVDKH